LAQSAFEISSTREKMTQEATMQSPIPPEFKARYDRWDQDSLDKLVIYLSQGNNSQIVKFSRMGMIQALIACVKNEIRKGQTKSQREAAFIALEKKRLEYEKKLQGKLDVGDVNFINNATVALRLLSKISLAGAKESHGQVNIFKQSFDENNGTNYLISLTDIMNTKLPLLTEERFQSCLTLTYLYIPTIPEAQKLEAICIPAIKEMLNDKNCFTLESVMQCIAFVVKFPSFL
jgi:hypothetical protein